MRRPHSFDAPIFLLILLITVLVSGSSLWSAEETDPEADASTIILDIALTQSQAYESLEWLSDRIGHRLSGSNGLEKAVSWTTGTMQSYGLKVSNEPVMVPHWVRGKGYARITSPVQLEMAMLELGGSVATPPGGVRAEVVIIRSLDEFEDMEDDALTGKIVLFSRPMKRSGEDGFGYGAASGLRVRGPSPAAAKGAIATMVRSLGTADYRLPHTGMLRYADDAPKVPAIAISVEDALLIERLIASGETVEVMMELNCQTLPDAQSANVIADLVGREKPEEIVVIACHLDSWDVGSGAIDDGSGCVMVMETLRLLKANDLIPRRTIRGILFTNEENGLAGGKAYLKEHLDEMPMHVAAIESDAGAGTPLGFGVSAGEGGVEMVRGMTRPLSVMDADEITDKGGGADIGPMRAHGVPQIGLRQYTHYYFDYHHTEADTFDKIDKGDLDRNVAAMALLAWELAEAEEPLPRLPLKEDLKD
jgi:hypothetical protein